MTDTSAHLGQLEEIAASALAQNQLSSEKATLVFDDLGRRKAAVSTATPGSLIRRLSQISQVLGVALILAALMWLLASNWSIFHRYTKLGFIFSVYLATNVSGGFLYFRVERYKFFGRLLMIAGLICFGLALALIGQAYNSNSDSYLLFLVWLVPTVSLYQVTRFPSLPVIAMILVNITYFTFMMDNEYALIVLLGAVLNLLLTAPMCSSKALQEFKLWPFLVSWLVLAYCLGSLTFWEVADEMCFVGSGAFIVFVAASIYVSIWVQRQPIIVGLSTALICLFIVAKFIEICVYHFSEEVFIIGFFVGLVLIGLEWLLVRLITGWLDKTKPQDETTADSESTKSDAVSTEAENGGTQ